MERTCYTMSVDKLQEELIHQQYEKLSTYPLTTPAVYEGSTYYSVYFRLRIGEVSTAYVDLYDGLGEKKVSPSGVLGVIRVSLLERTLPGVCIPDPMGFLNSYFGQNKNALITLSVINFRSLFHLLVVK